MPTKQLYVYRTWRQGIDEIAPRTVAHIVAGLGTPRCGPGEFNPFSGFGRTEADLVTVCGQAAGPRYRRHPIARFSHYVTDPTFVGLTVCRKCATGRAWGS